MTLKDTKSSQEILHEMKTAEREKTQEIEMEGATIKGAMPTFKNLTKSIVSHRPTPGSLDIDGTPLRPIVRNPTGQIFTLPTGKQVVLVPEDEISEFLGDDTVVGFGAGETGSVDPRRVMRSPAAETFKRNARPVGHERRVASHHLGGGFHVLLGVEQEYQPDKSSFGTYEMTADGPVRVDDGEPTTKSIPIVFYSDPNKPAEYETLVGPFDKEKAERGLLEYEKAYYPSLGMDLMNRPDRVARQSGMGTYDTGIEYYNVRTSEIRPELKPEFTARDIIDGYKAAKSAPKVAPPQEIEPAPPPEPTPEPPSPFTGFEMPVVDTLKGRRRAAKRRFPGRQELTDE